MDWIFVFLQISYIETKAVPRLSNTFPTWRYSEVEPLRNNYNQMRSGGWNGISAFISVTEELTFSFFFFFLFFFFCSLPSSSFCLEYEGLQILLYKWMNQQINHGEIPFQITIFILKYPFHWLYNFWHSFRLQRRAQ